MVEFVLGVIALVALCAVAIVAVNAHMRLGDHEEDNERRDARIVDLGRQVHELRRRQTPPINRPPVNRWTDDLEHRIRRSA